MGKWFLGALLVLFAGMAHAELKVVTTTSTLGMVARTVGGEGVAVTVLAPPDRNAHDLQARPSMMAALRRADLVVAVGADLEAGWLPAALQGAANPALQPGRPGYFEAAASVRLIGTEAPADRAHGHTHPAGNPHLNLDPLRIAEVGEALAARMGQMHPAGADRFAANARAFRQQVEARLPEWLQQAEGAPGILPYHEDFDYLGEWLGVPILGAIEPLPGIPPSARHLRELVHRYQGQAGVILAAAYQSDRSTRFLGDRLEWPVRHVSTEPPMQASAADYLALVDEWVAAVASGRP